MTGVSDVPLWWLLMACWMHFAAIGGFVKAVVEVFGKGKDNGEGEGEEEERFRDEVEGEMEKDVDSTLMAVQEDDESCTSHLAASTSPSSPSLESSLPHLPSPEAPQIPWQFRLLPLLPQTTTAAINAALLFYTRSLSLPTSTTWRDKSPLGWCILATLCLCGVLFAKGCNLFIFFLRNKAPRNLGCESATAFWFRRITNLMFLFVARAGMRWVTGQDVWSFPSVDGHGNLEIPSKLTDVGTDKVWPDRKVFDRAMGAIPDWVGHVVTMLNFCIVCAYLVMQRREKQRQKRAEEMKEGAGEE